MKSSRNKGRPPLKTGRRIKKIDARFTEEEYTQILEMEKQLGISKTELVRLRVLNNAANIVINAAELIGHLDAIGTEMGRAGNNINQLARHANMLAKQGQLSPALIQENNRLLERWVSIQLSMEAALRKLIRKMST
ncbi:MAG: plasmid mobilization relaxosome protein MobC [Pedobacter sp.]|nr:MAG: plasmid mobilization relaxosome protein MobC [Pedobacter sp.]